MPANASEWDVRHQAAVQGTPPEPASFVREMLPLLPVGPALDLACGTGRHTMLLASRPQPVVAVDWSPVGLAILEQRARSLNLAVSRASGPEIATSGAFRGIRRVQADLESAVLPAGAFALILCVQYLQRSLFPHIEQALLPGGVMLFETFTRAQLEFTGGPRNPVHLLGLGELRTAFPGLEVLFYRELRAGQGIASLVARKPRERR
jgi:tellurite methyltransferase